MTVLIVSQELDATADAVVLALGDRGIPVFRVDQARFPRRLSLEAELRDGGWMVWLDEPDNIISRAPPD